MPRLDIIQKIRKGRANQGQTCPVIIGHLSIAGDFIRWHEFQVFAVEQFAPLYGSVLPFHMDMCSTSPIGCINHEAGKFYMLYLGGNPHGLSCLNIEADLD